MTAGNFLTNCLQAEATPDRDRLKLRQLASTGIFAFKQGNRDMALKSWERVRQQIPDRANDARLFERLMDFTSALPSDCGLSLIDL